jgi:hypothetical protein
MIIYLMTTALFFPGNVEYLLVKANSCGNMAWYSMFLRVYYTRNFVYLSMSILCISYYYNYTNYGLMLFLFSLFLFRNACFQSIEYK